VFKVDGYEIDPPLVAVDISADPCTLPSVSPLSTTSDENPNINVMIINYCEVAIQSLGTGCDVTISL
jgi:hypothetical protein